MAADEKEPTNFGVPTEDYVLGLKAELANAVTDEHKAAIQAELKVAGAK